MDVDFIKQIFLMNNYFENTSVKSDIKPRTFIKLCLLADSYLKRVQLMHLLRILEKQNTHLCMTFSDHTFTDPYSFQFIFIPKEQIFSPLKGMFKLQLMSDIRMKSLVH